LFGQPVGQLHGLRHLGAELLLLGFQALPKADPLLVSQHPGLRPDLAAKSPQLLADVAETLTGFIDMARDLVGERLMGRPRILLAALSPLGHGVGDRGPAAAADLIAHGRECGPDAFGLEFIGSLPDGFQGAECHYSTVVCYTTSYTTLRCGLQAAFGPHP